MNSDLRLYSLKSKPLQASKRVHRSLLKESEIRDKKPTQLIPKSQQKNITKNIKDKPNQLQKCDILLHVCVMTETIGFHIVVVLGRVFPYHIFTLNLG